MHDEWTSSMYIEGDLVIIRTTTSRMRLEKKKKIFLMQESLDVHKTGF